jgi:hypothetical protein
VLVRCACVVCMYLCVELHAAFESDETAQPSGLALAATCMHYLRVRQVVRVRVVWCARGIHIDPYVFRSPDMHAWAAPGVLPCILWNTQDLASKENKIYIIYMYIPLSS